MKSQVIARTAVVLKNLEVKTCPKTQEKKTTAHTNPEYIIHKSLTASLIKSYCSFVGPWLAL